MLPHQRRQFTILLCLAIFGFVLNPAKNRRMDACCIGDDVCGEGDQLFHLVRVILSDDKTHDSPVAMPPKIDGIQAQLIEQFVHVGSQLLVS